MNRQTPNNRLPIDVIAGRNQRNFRWSIMAILICVAVPSFFTKDSLLLALAVTVSVCVVMIILQTQERRAYTQIELQLFTEPDAIVLDILDTFLRQKQLTLPMLRVCTEARFSQLEPRLAALRRLQYVTAQLRHEDEFYLLTPEGHGYAMDTLNRFRGPLTATTGDMVL